MRAEIKKFHGFYWTEFREEERWLEKLAGEGLLLKHRGIFFSDFEKGIPSERRYRIFDHMKAEEKNLIESSGWTCAEDTIRPVVFFADEPETVEIITDRQGFRAHFGKLIRSVVWHMFQMLFLIWFNFSRMQRANDIGWGVLHDYDRSLDLAAIDILFLLLVLLCCVWPMLKDIRYIFIYTAGRLEKVQSYQKCVLLNKVRWGFTLLAFALLLVLLGVTLGNEGSRKYCGEQALNDQIDEMVPFSAVDSAAYDRISDELLKSTDEERFPMDSNALMSVEVMQKSILFKKSFYQSVEAVSDETASDNGNYETELFYSQRFYEARSEKIAGDYLTEEILISPDVDDNGGVRYVQADRSYQDDISIMIDGVDYAGYEIEDPGSDRAAALPVQTLYLRKGTKLMIINYIGMEDLKSKAMIFVERMQS